MDITPEDVIVSFLQQAQNQKMGIVVFAGFERDGKFILRSNHTLRDDAAKSAFVLKFMAFDDRAIEAATQVLHKVLHPDQVWEDLSQSEQLLLLQATRTALTIAIAVATTNAPVTPDMPVDPTKKVS